MKITFKLFSLLDLISLVFLGMQLINILSNFNSIPVTTLSILKVIGMLYLFVTITIAAFGQYTLKKYSLILYYFQFPIRLLLWVFSVGFITLLPEAFNLFEDYWFEILFKVCIVAEFYRLYFTYRTQRKLL